MNLSDWEKICLGRYFKLWLEELALKQETKCTCVLRKQCNNCREGTSTRNIDIWERKHASH